MFKICFRTSDKAISAIGTDSWDTGPQSWPKTAKKRNILNVQICSMRQFWQSHICHENQMWPYLARYRLLKLAENSQKIEKVQTFKIFVPWHLEKPISVIGNQISPYIVRYKPSKSENGQNIEKFQYFCLSHVDEVSGRNGIHNCCHSNNMSSFSLLSKRVKGCICRAHELCIRFHRLFRGAQISKSLLVPWRTKWPLNTLLPPALSAPTGPHFIILFRRTWPTLPSHFQNSFPHSVLSAIRDSPRCDHEVPEAIPETNHRVTVRCDLNGSPPCGSH